MKRLFILPIIMATFVINSSFLFADQIQPLLDVGEVRQKAALEDYQESLRYCQNNLACSLWYYT